MTVIREIRLKNLTPRVISLEVIGINMVDDFYDLLLTFHSNHRPISYTVSKIDY